jgi:hypothetical protein
MIWLLSLAACAVATFILIPRHAVPDEAMPD